jgi:peptidoglycan/xylan/chitin deacetylase (PgdA/CDA1 family)
MEKGVVTIFFDYEGKWARADQGENCRRGVNCILDILEAENIRGTFNIVGELLKDETSVVERIQSNNHEIASHTLRHTVVDNFSASQMAEDITKFKKLSIIRNIRLRGFRGPRSRWTPKTLRGLLNTNILWTADNDNASYPYIILKNAKRRLWRMPVHVDDWLFESEDIKPRKMLAIWTEQLITAQENNHFTAIGFHPWILAKQPERMEVFREFIAMLGKLDNIKVIPFGDVADLCEGRVID